ncbi:VCBS repeat-containing protein [Streptomyces sp. TLI_146]|uniref:FG-GAP repeat domain-containing protein n=1 Tax=Streptomyces sp. TLI_146 TaxID=1938858 RepID=UPI000C70A125|nr:VCBS repeat-containing protein [Streptomyces sp. TLI_146]PKV77092.1 FlgD-like protein [Streptomyces sp. TLI_146]
MRRHTLVRSAVAAVTTIGLAVGLTPLVAAPALGADAVPPEVSIPAELYALDDAGTLISAGDSGVLGGTYQGSDRTYQGDFRWISYADGTVKTVPHDHWRYAAVATGSDYVALYGNDASGTFFVELRDMRNGGSKTVSLPAYHRLAGAFGDTVMTTTSASAPEGEGRYLLTAENGKTVTRRVTGFPEGAKLLAGPSYRNGQGMLGSYELDGVQHRFWLDSSARVRLVGLPATPDAVSTLLAGDKVVLLRKDGTVQVWGLTANTRPEREFHIAYQSGDHLLGLLGDQALLARPTTPVQQPEDKKRFAYGVWAAPADGSEPRRILDRTTAAAVLDPSGRVLIARAGEGLERSVYAIRAGAEGAGPEPVKVADLPSVAARTAVTAVAQGQVNTLDAMPVPGASLRLRGVRLSVGAPLTAGTRVDRGAETDTPFCDDSSCSHLLTTGDGRTLTRLTATGMMRVVDDGQALPGRQFTPDTPFNTLVAASGRYAAFYGWVDPPPSPKNQLLSIVDIDSGRTVATQPYANEAFALWGNRLYVEAAGEPGRVRSTTVGAASSAGSPFKVASCDLTDLQAVASRIYWACKADKQAGVYDTATGRTSAVPYAEQTRLADGYLASAADGTLSLTDLSGTRPASRSIGQVPSSYAGTSWDVDRFGGPLVYSDAQGVTHIVPSGADASALTDIDTDAPAVANVKSGPWAARWWLSRPAATWKLTLTSRATGATVRTLAGGEARGLVKAGWDGRTEDGRLAVDGAYAWTLTALPADGHGPALTRTGTLRLTGAAPAPRDYVGRDGIGDLLAFTPSGIADFRAGTDRGGVDPKVSGSGWTGANTVTSAVPFDDIDGDGSNDVLVRVSSGELRTYRPGGKALTATTPYTPVGGGWNIFDALTSPGDMTGDGRADVLAREAATGDLYLYEANGSGNFKARVKVGEGWKGYLLASGAGDVNGDGKADLLARDVAGVLWLYPGTGSGRLTARVRVGGGWQIYNSLVGAGDLNADGKPDLLARGADGVLWSYAGDGRGNFTGRQRVGGGWQMYKYLF